MDDGDGVLYASRDATKVHDVEKSEDIKSRESLQGKGYPYGTKVMIAGTDTVGTIIRWDHDENKFVVRTPQNAILKLTDIQFERIVFKRDREPGEVIDPSSKKPKFEVVDEPAGTEVTPATDPAPAPAPIPAPKGKKRALELRSVGATGEAVVTEIPEPPPKKAKPEADPKADIPGTAKPGTVPELPEATISITAVKDKPETEDLPAPAPAAAAATSLASPRG